MPVFLLLLVTVLSACTASVTQQAEPLDIVRDLVFMDAPEVHLELIESGSEYLGKFATVSALNSNRSFVSDFYGEVRITLFPSKKVECRWWAEGRVTDPMFYDGVNGFIKAYSTLCTGKLQRDGTFEFQGAYVSDGPEHTSDDAAEDESDETFTLRGIASQDTIHGAIVVGGPLQNSVSLEDPSNLVIPEEGIAFEAVLTEQILE